MCVDVALNVCGAGYNTEAVLVDAASGDTQASFSIIAAIVFTNAFSASSVPDNFEYKLRLASITVSAVSRSSQQVQSRIHHSKLRLV